MKSSDVSEIIEIVDQMDSSILKQCISFEDYVKSIVEKRNKIGQLETTLQKIVNQRQIIELQLNETNTNLKNVKDTSNILSTEENKLLSKYKEIDSLLTTNKSNYELKNKEFVDLQNKLKIQEQINSN